MTREQIENAAMLSCASKDEVLTDFGSSCFIEGAKWRINSVWHDASEEPKNENVPILIEYSTCGIDGFCYMVCDDILDYDIQRHVTYCTVLRWAYLDDLLPERKEETE